MKGYLLDTNVPSETLRPVPNPNVLAWFRRQGDDPQFLSVVTVGELRRGTTLLALGTKRSKLERFIETEIPLWFESRILPVTQAIAERWGVLDAKAQLSGAPVNTADAIIAATALELGLTLVTRNVKHFTGFGVLLVNPWA